MIIGSGSALAQGGPASLLIGYLAMGACCWVTLTALGEMSAFIPSKNGFAGHASRFVDPAYGFTTGWTYLFKYLVTTPNQINASVLLISYWRTDLSPAIFVTIFIVFIVLSNFCGIRFFGVFEYGLSFSKILILTAIIIAGFTISLGANPANDRIGFVSCTLEVLDNQLFCLDSPLNLPLFLSLSVIGRTGVPLKNTKSREIWAGSLAFGLC